MNGPLAPLSKNREGTKRLPLERRPLPELRPAVELGSLPEALPLRHLHLGAGLGGGLVLLPAGHLAPAVLADDEPGYLAKPLRALDAVEAYLPAAVVALLVLVDVPAASFAYHLNTSL